MLLGQLTEDPLVRAMNETEIKVPCDANETVTPQMIVPPHQRRLTGFDVAERCCVGPDVVFERL